MNDMPRMQNDGPPREGGRNGGNGSGTVALEGSRAWEGRHVGRWWFGLGVVGALGTASAAHNGVQAGAPVVSFGEASLTVTDVLFAVAVVGVLLTVRGWKPRVSSWPVARGLQVYVVCTAPAAFSTLVFGGSGELAWGLRLGRFAVLYGIAVAIAVWLGGGRDERMGVLLRAVNVGTLIGGLLLGLHLLNLYAAPGFEDIGFGSHAGGIWRVSIMSDSALPIQGAFAAAGLVSGGRAVDRWLGGIAAVVVPAAVLISPGRGAALVVGFVIISVLMLLLGQRRVRVTQAVMFVASILVAAVLVAAWAGLHTGNSLEESVAKLASVQEGGSLTSQQTRMRGWSAGMELTSRAPVLGNGLGMRYNDLHVDYATDSSYTIPSMYIDTAARAGVVGLFGMLALLLSPIVFSGVGPSETIGRIMRSRYGMYCLVALVAFLGRGVNDQIFFSQQNAILVGLILGYLGTVVRPALGTRALRVKRAC